MYIYIYVYMHICIHDIITTVGLRLRLHVRHAGGLGAPHGPPIMIIIIIILL